MDIHKPEDNKITKAFGQGYANAVYGITYQGVPIQSNDKTHHAEALSYFDGWNYGKAQLNRLANKKL